MKRKKRCLECKELFMPKRTDQVVCSKKRCKMDRANTLQNISWSNKNHDWINCSECNKSFKPIMSTQFTCGTEICKKSRKNRIRRVGIEVEFDCQVCGDKTWSNLPGAVLCGKKDCRKKYVNKINIKNNYKGAAREFCKKYATKKGSFTRREIGTLIKNRLLGATYKENALILSRTLSSVEKETIKIWKNKDNYRYFFKKTVKNRVREYEKFEDDGENIRKGDISHWNQKIKECFA